MNITDSLNAITPHHAGVVAFTAIDRLQDFTPAEQVAGAAFLFQLLLRRFGQDARIVLPAAGRRLDDALAPAINNKQGDITRALRNYLNEEV